MDWLWSIRSHLDQGKYEDDAPKGKGKGKKGKSKSKFLGSSSRLVDLFGNMSGTC